MDTVPRNTGDKNVVARAVAGTGMHRGRDGRLDVDQFSRRLIPRWRMVRVDGRFFERKALARWLLERGVSPVSRRPVTGAEFADATNANPYRIYGKAPMRAANLAAKR